MVAAAHRISRGSDFDRTLKTGVRVTTRDLVVHVLPIAGSPVPVGGSSADVRGGVGSADIATVGGPWLGLIVSKAVGNAVVRHRTARRLRAAFHDCVPHFPIHQTMLVIRARPSAADCSSLDLADQIADALTRRRAREVFDAARAIRRTHEQTETQVP